MVDGEPGRTVDGFRFRLERLLELRRAKEDAARRVLAEARAAVQEETRRLTGLLAEEEEGKRTSRRLLQGVLDLSALRNYEGWQNAVDRRIRASRERVLDLGRAEAGKRKALSEAMKAVRVLERFRERKRADWSRAEDRRERAALDEAAAAGMFRRLEGA